MGKQQKSKTSLGAIIMVVFLLIFGIAAYKIFGPNTITHKYLYVKTGASYNDLLTAVKNGGFVADGASFELLAGAWKLNEHVHSGRYDVTKGMSNFTLIRKLRNGSQAEVKLVINKLRTKQDLIRLLAANMETDSETIVQTFSSTEFLDQFGLDTATLMCAIIPNTYQFYWNTPLDKILKKIHKSYTAFWTDERKQKAKQMGLDPIKATIIASILEEESNDAEDKPNIASVYLNRLNKGMKLQADPTVKFAIGDFSIKRVTSNMLKTPSPYNTYQNTGLPPGPICTPMPGTIDAVLNAPITNYIYFCASANLDGKSVFAATGEEHMKNARRYQEALNVRGIH